MGGRIWLDEHFSGRTIPIPQSSKEKLNLRTDWQCADKIRFFVERKNSLKIMYSYSGVLKFIKILSVKLNVLKKHETILIKNWMSDNDL